MCSTFICEKCCAVNTEDMNVLFQKNKQMCSFLPGEAGYRRIARDKLILAI